MRAPLVMTFLLSAGLAATSSASEWQIVKGYECRYIVTNASTSKTFNAQCREPISQKAACVATIECSKAESGSWRCPDVESLGGIRHCAEIVAGLVDYARK